MTLALVLGGGGIAGVAWHTGMVAGLAEAGLDLTDASMAVGTSAGATVAAQVMAGRDIDVLMARQIDTILGSRELAPPVPMSELWERLAPIYGAQVAEGERRRMLGTLALETETVSEAVRRGVLEDRLDGVDWPSEPGRRLCIVVVEAATGQRRVIDGASGVPLVDAVTASSAVPGVWPPATIAGTRYVDGGIWSLANADLVHADLVHADLVHADGPADAVSPAGPDQVVVLAPLSDPALDDQVAEYPERIRYGVVTPDADSLAAFGADVLDPAVRGPAARAGLAQGRAEASRLADLIGR
jgi:NTE family protein